MTAQLTRRRMRFLCDANTRTSDKMLDLLTGATPELWTGNAVQMEIAIGMSQAIVTDISNIASLTVDVKPSSATRTQAAVMTATVAAEDLNAGLTQENWDSLFPMHCHALVTFSGGQTARDVGADLQDAYWLIVSVITTAGDEITLQYTILTLVEDGTGSAGPAAEEAPLYYTRDQMNALFVKRHENNAAMQWHQGRWYHYIADTGLWYPEVALRKDNIPQVSLGEGASL